MTCPSRAAACALLLLLASCAGLDRDDQGRLQPQSVRGPCDAKKFFLLGFISVDASLAVEDTGTPSLTSYRRVILRIAPARR